jgi:hypothetical protein
MPRELLMKRFTLIALVLLAGCSVFEQLKIVGQWETTVTFFTTYTVTYDFQSSGDLVVSYDDGDPPNSGRWSIDGARLTIRWDSGVTAELLYDFPDNDTLQLTPVEGIGLSIILTRV